jgi:hypothetical protein
MADSPAKIFTGFGETQWFAPRQWVSHCLEFTLGGSNQTAGWPLMGAGKEEFAAMPFFFLFPLILWGGMCKVAAEQSEASAHSASRPPFTE